MPYQIVHVGDDGQFLGYYRSRYYLFRWCAERRARILNTGHRHSSFFVESTR